MAAARVPPSLVKPGLVWGAGDGVLFAYAETKEHLRGVPDEIDGVRVEKRVVGKIRPARLR